MEEFGLHGHLRPRVCVEFVDRLDEHDPARLRVALVIERELQEGLRQQIVSAVQRMVLPEGNEYVLLLVMRHIYADQCSKDFKPQVYDEGLD